MAVFTHKHLSVTVKDDTGTPITATLGPGPGDLSYSTLEQGDVEALAVYNRGTYLEAVDGDQKQITGSITIYHDGDQTGSSVLDAVRKTGSFASGVTVDPGLVSWMLDIVVTATRGAVTNTWTFSTCRITADFTETKDGNTWTLNFTCYQGVAIT